MNTNKFKIKFHTSVAGWMGGSTVGLPREGGCAWGPPSRAHPPPERGAWGEGWRGQASRPRRGGEGAARGRRGRGHGRTRDMITRCAGAAAPRAPDPAGWDRARLAFLW